MWQQHSCERQSISAVIALTTKDPEMMIVCAVILNPVVKLSGSPLHEIKRRDGLIKYGVLIPFPDLCGREEFHNVKIQRYNTNLAEKPTAAPSNTTPGIIFISGFQSSEMFRGTDSNL